MIRTCLYCKKEFNTYPYKIKKGKGLYCSVECYHNAKSLKVICKNCGKEFIVFQSRHKAGRGVFCSKSCKHNYTPRQKKVKCDYCKKVYIAKISELERSKHKYCSRECAAKDYKNHYSGENSSKWTGGKQRDKHNSNYRYSDWRLSVYERDGFTCQSCGQVGGKLNAHHIFLWSEYPSFRYETWNGITLCEKCHKEEHKGGAKWEIKKAVASRAQSHV